MTEPSKELETFRNPRPGNDYLVRIVVPEFTALCPKTGQPDFATLMFEYVPGDLCVELKALKLYLWSFRNEGHFHEDVTGLIADKLEEVLKPKFLRVSGYFYIRGGITTMVFTERGKTDMLVTEIPPINYKRPVEAYQ